MSKRSSHLRLTLMAAAAPAALLLTSCQDPPTTGQVLQGDSQCEIQTDVSPADCHAAYQKALSEHQKVAPQFVNQTECDDQFGACTVVRNDQGQSHWIPPMTGFLLGYLASDLINGSARNRNDCDRSNDPAGACRGTGSGGYRTVAGASPLYRDYRTNEYRGPSGDVVSDGIGRVSGDAGRAIIPARAVTVSRAGFGSASAARSSFSSSRGFGGHGFGG